MIIVQSNCCITYVNFHRVNHRYESLHLNVMNRKKSVMSQNLN